MNKTNFPYKAYHKDGRVANIKSESGWKNAEAEGFSKEEPSIFKTYKVYHEDGRVADIKSDTGWKNAEAEGFSKEAPIKEQVLPMPPEEEKTSLFDDYLATQAGVARGATLGISDYIIPHIAGAVGSGVSLFTEDTIEEGYTKGQQKAKDYLLEQKEKSPILSTAAEIGGAIVPAFIPEPTSTAASAGRIGTSVAKLASRIAAAESKSVAKKIAIGSGKGVIRGGAEGIAGSLTNEISNVVLNDDAKFSAEVIENGMVLGASLGLGGKLASSLWSRIKPGSSTLNRAINALDAQVDAVRKRMSEVSADNPNANIILGNLKIKLKGFVDDRSLLISNPGADIPIDAIEEFAPSERYMKVLSKYADLGIVQRRSAQIPETLVKVGSPINIRIGKLHDIVYGFGKVEGKMPKDTIAYLNSIIRDPSQLLPKHRIKLESDLYGTSNLISDAAENILSSLKKQKRDGKISVEDLAKAKEEINGFLSVWKTKDRATFDRITNNIDDPRKMEDLLVKMKGVIEVIKEHGTEKSVGIVKNLIEDKSIGPLIKILVSNNMSKSIAKHAVGKQPSKYAGPLGGLLGGGAGLGIGSISNLSAAGLAFSGTSGGALGAGVMMAGRRAMQIGKDPLGDIAIMRGISSVNPKIKHDIGKALDTMLSVGSGLRRTTASVYAISKGKDQLQMQTEINKLMSNEEALRANINKALDEAGFDEAPNIKANKIEHTINSLRFLQSKFKITKSNMYGDKRSTISPSESRRFKIYYNYVMDPNTLIRDIKDSKRIRPEAIEVLKVVYPEMLETIREGFGKYFQNNKLSLKQKRLIERLFDEGPVNTIKIQGLYNREGTEKEKPKSAGKKPTEGATKRQVGAEQTAAQNLNTPNK